MTSDPLDQLLENLIREVNLKNSSIFYMGVLRTVLNQNKEVIRVWLKRNVNLINQIAKQ